MNIIFEKFPEIIIAVFYCNSTYRNSRCKCWLLEILKFESIIIVEEKDHLLLWKYITNYQLLHFSPDIKTFNGHFLFNLKDDGINVRLLHFWMKQ